MINLKRLKNGRWFAMLPMAIALLACATTPPPSGLLEQAMAGLDRADKAGGQDHAPIEMRFAREKLAGANMAMEEGEYERAARLVEQSVINSDLAIAKVAAANAREAADQQNQANAQVRSRLDDGGAP